MTDLWEHTLLDWQFGGTAINLPGTVYVGLWTATLSDTSAGTTAGEVSGGGYARQAVARNNTNFDPASGGSINNKTVINFGTASADWGTVTHMGLLSAATDGTLYYHMDLTASKIVQNGDAVQIAASGLVVSQS
jgi:hypothetical protein